MNTGKNIKSGILSSVVAVVVYLIIAAIATKGGFGKELIFSSLMTGAAITGAATFLIAFVSGSIVSMKKQAN